MNISGPLSGPLTRLIAHSRACAAVFLALASTIPAESLLARGEVTLIHTTERQASPYRYQTAEHELTWGGGVTQIMTGFDYGGETYGFVDSADRIDIKRVDRPGVRGNICAAMAERTLDPQIVQPGYPHDTAGGSGCDMVALLNERVINRGALNVFSNIGDHPNNIERVDFVFEHGISAPLKPELMARSGHVVSEKRGNNPIQIAAILALDEHGAPSAYGRLVRVNPFGCDRSELCYGVTPLTHNYTFFYNGEGTPVGERGQPGVFQYSTESVAMAFVTLEDLGIEAGSRYFGYSFFGKDVVASEHDLLNPASFPADTADLDSPGDGADIYGGSSGYFSLAKDSDSRGSVSQITISVFNDIDGDGAKADTEAGLEGIAVSLVQDTNLNGLFDPLTDTPVVQPTESDAGGEIVLPGIPGGTYLVVLDETDGDIPDGMSLPPGHNPVLLVLPGSESNVNFAFTNNPVDRVDDDATGAGPSVADDSASGPQDQVLVIDVLANDTDPAGDGLTITAISGVVNGSASISDGKVRYAPDAGYVGATAFTYTAEDSLGRSGSANVAVTIVRFSDINDNGLNDYDECDCDSLMLVTGVDGVGVGSLWLLLPWLLGSALWQRRSLPRGVEVE